MTPLHVGLTGGIGSGKTTVADLFAARGAAVVDTDAIAHELTAPGGAAIAAIRAEFGDAVIRADGALDRDAMRALVYRDPDARAALEAIIHPLVAQETERQAAQAEAQGRALLVFDVPLLVESGARWRARLDRVLVIDCPPEVQVARVVARNQLAPDQVEAILAAQAGRLQRLAAADWVLYNGQGVTVRDLAAQIDRIAARLRL